MGDNPKTLIFIGKLSISSLSLVVIIGCWVLGVGCLVPSAGYWMQPACQCPRTRRTPVHSPTPPAHPAHLPTHPPTHPPNQPTNELNPATCAMSLKTEIHFLCVLKSSANKLRDCLGRRAPFRQHNSKRCQNNIFEIHQIRPGCFRSPQSS